MSNPVKPNDIPPPTWPSYVPPVTSRRVEERRNRRRGPASASPANDETSAAPMTSEIDARTAIVVRRLQNDAKETDRSRSKMLRKRVRREERSERRHLRKRLRRRQGGSVHGQQGRRTSETTEMSFSSMTSSFSTSTGTDATTTTTTTTSSSTSSVATTSYGPTVATRAASSSLNAQGTPPATALPPATGYDDKVYTSSSQPMSSYNEAVPIPFVDEDTHFSELYLDVFMASNRPQFLATLGGRLVACELSRALCVYRFDFRCMHFV